MAHITVNRLLGGPGNASTVPSYWTNGTQLWYLGERAVASYRWCESTIRGHEVEFWVDDSIGEDSYLPVVEWHVATLDERLFQTQKELLKEGMAAASQYTNVIMVVGYAALFAFWTQMKASFETWTTLLSASLMMVSLMLFIGWELFQMVLRSYNIMGLAHSVDDPAQFPERMLAHGGVMADLSRRLAKPWVAVTASAIITGVSAMLVMLSAFIHGLFVSLM